MKKAILIIGALVAVLSASVISQEVPVTLESPVTITEVKVTQKSVSSVKIQTVYVNLTDSTVTIKVAGCEPEPYPLSEEEYNSFLTLIGPFLRGVVRAQMAPEPSE